MHARFHLIVERPGIRRLRAGRSDLAPEIDGHAHFVEQVHAKNPVNRAAAGFANGTEIDGRQSQIAEDVASECKFGQRHLAGAGGGGSAPGGHSYFLGPAGGKRFEVEHGGRAGVQEEAHIRAVDLDFHDRQEIATLDGNLARGRDFLRAENGRGEKQESRKKDRNTTGRPKHAF